jgi:hypothetical protein
MLRGDFLRRSGARSWEILSGGEKASQKQDAVVVRASRFYRRFRLVRDYRQHQKKGNASHPALKTQGIPGCCREPVNWLPDVDIFNNLKYQHRLYLYVTLPFILNAPISASAHCV